MDDTSNIYREVLLEGKREFRLNADGVEIKGYVVMGPQFETFIRFDHLDSRVSTVKARHNLFWNALFALLCFFIATVVFVQMFGFEGRSLLLVSAIAGTALSLVVAVLTCRETEYACFNNRSGVLLMNIARSGPDSQYFDSFVATIHERIEALKSDLELKLAT